MVAALGGGCSTSPVSGRQQLNVLAEPIHAVYSDLRFGVLTAPRVQSERCASDAEECRQDEVAIRLQHEIGVVAGRLVPVAAKLSPELWLRVPLIEVFVVDDSSPGTSSSPGGRIAIHAGIAALGLNDAELAFVVAREIGRLAHAHHREIASAGAAASVATNLILANTTVASLVILDFLVPWSALFKFAAAFGSSVAAQAAIEVDQQEEADEFAGRLLVEAGYDLATLRRDIPEQSSGLAKLRWISAFYNSRQWAADNAQRLASADGGIEMAPPYAAPPLDQPALPPF
jgi:hypothetical protein